MAYLYCRMLDTYEDLVPDRASRERSLHAFASRFDARDAVRHAMPRAPQIDNGVPHDARDRAHLLLVRRADLVDRVFLSFDSATQLVVRDLVRDMADGMRWSSATFERQGGVLCGEQQLATYCRHVLGNPVVFGVRLMRLRYGAPPQLSPAEREDAMQIGEMVQLANVTRDVEKDLRRGIAYDEALRMDLGRDATNGTADAALVERCRIVRERLLRMALARAEAYGRILRSMPLPRWSVARASAVLMLLFTERYFRACAQRIGVNAWPAPRGMTAILARTFSATFSSARAEREIARIETAFLSAARR